MTVENTNLRISYNGNGSVISFAYNFLVYSEDHLFIYFDSVLQTVGFIVDGIGNDSGGDVTFAIPPLTGVEVKIERNVPFTQMIEYQQYGPFDAESNERGLDLSAMRDLQIEDQYLKKCSTDEQDICGPINFLEQVTFKNFAPISETNPTLDNHLVRLQDVKVSELVLDSTFQKFPIISIPGMTVINSPIAFQSAIPVIDGIMQFETSGDYEFDTDAKTVTLSAPLTGREVIELWVNNLFTETSPNLVGEFKTYNTVADMVADELLINNTVASTINHTSAIDGGGAEYDIIDPVDFTGTINSANITLSNGRIASLRYGSTVLLEQLGVTSTDTASDELNDAVNLPGVTIITSNLDSATFDKVAFIEQNGITVNLLGTKVTYIGDYDVYEQFGESVDRSIGLVNSKGVLGIDAAVVTSLIVDGTNVVTLDDAASFTIDDYIQLSIVYPRRADTQVARITAISGNDVTLDYTFGWTVTSCSITKIDTMRQCNSININMYDDSQATDDANKIAGVGFKYSANCSASWVVENHTFPACIAYYSQDLFLHDGFATNPKNIDPGRGYNIQINKSNRVDCVRLISRNCRHNWDSSGSSYCTIRDSYAYEPVDNISQYTTHGIYEHDLLVENCYHFDGQNAFSIGQSGVAFGSQTKRFKIIGGRFNGVIKSENAKQFTMKDVSFYGEQVSEHEFAGTEGTLISNVNFQTVAQIRITVPTDITGPDGIPSIDDIITFENCDFNDNLLRTTDLKGSLTFKGCKNYGVLSDSDLIDYPYNITFDECQFDIVSGWELKPLNNLTIKGCEFTIDSSISFSAGNIAHLSGGCVTSAVSNARIKFNAPTVIANQVTTKNSVGIFAEANCKTFNLSDVTSIEPDAGHTSNQFTVEGTTDCTWTINGMNVKYEGSGNSILFVNATLLAVMAGSYVKGNIQVGAIAGSAFAGNITPDTVLP